MKKTESIILTLITAALIMLFYKLFKDSYVWGISIYDLLRLPLTVWIAYFAANVISKVEKPRIIQAIMGITCGVVIAVSLSTSPQEWYMYLIKGILPIIGAILLYFYLKVRNLV